MNKIDKSMLRPFNLDEAQNYWMRFTHKRLERLTDDFFNSLNGGNIIWLYF